MEEKKYLVIDGKQTKIENLTGQKFGRLTVIGFDEIRYKRDIIRRSNKEIKTISIHWLCECECENTVSVSGYNLKSNHTQSCGCLNKEYLNNKAINLLGKRFGKLIVLERDYDKQNQQINDGKLSKVFWKCKCDCGNYTVVQSTNLTNSHTQSCGCMVGEKLSEVVVKNALTNNGSLGEWILNNLPSDFLKKYWSENNKLSPFEIPFRGSKEIYIICDKCNTEYSITPYEFTYLNMRCHKCNIPKGENRIMEYLEKNQITYDCQVKFTGLVGLNGGQLSYDFMANNILIEFQGEFHDGTARIQTEEGFEIQKEHDRRKREYAKKNNIELLEIWYWDFDNIEKILKSKIN